MTKRIVLKDNSFNPGMTGVNKNVVVEATLSRDGTAHVSREELDRIGVERVPSVLGSYAFHGDSFDYE